MLAAAMAGSSAAAESVSWRLRSAAVFPASCRTELEDLQRIRKGVIELYLSDFPSGRPRVTPCSGPLPDADLR